MRNPQLKQDTPRLRGKPLPEPHRRAVVALIKAEGERAAAARLGVPHHTLARAVAGFGLRRGTTVLIEQALGRLNDAST
jgi:hypothetical protein